MSIDPTVTRRALLAAGAGGLGAAVLAGCSSGGSNDGPPASSGSSTRSGGDDAIASLKDFAVGESDSVDLPGGKEGIVTRTGRRSAACFTSVCPHEGGTVVPDGDRLTCTRHGSQFDPKTGDVLRGPATSNLPAIDISVENGSVVTA